MTVAGEGCWPFFSPVAVTSRAAMSRRLISWPAEVEGGGEHGVIGDGRAADRLARSRADSWPSRVRSRTYSRSIPKARRARRRTVVRALQLAYGPKRVLEDTAVAAPFTRYRVLVLRMRLAPREARLSHRVPSRHQRRPGQARRPTSARLRCRRPRSTRPTGTSGWPARPSRGGAPSRPRGTPSTVIRNME
jgi:hypothetical protein